MISFTKQAEGMVIGLPLEAVEVWGHLAVLLWPHHQVIELDSLIKLGLDPQPLACQLQLPIRLQLVYLLEQQLMRRHPRHFKRFHHPLHNLITAPIFIQLLWDQFCRNLEVDYPY